MRIQNQVYVRRTCAALLLFSVLACRAQNAPVPPEAVRGSLDLSAWDFDKDGMMPLSGEWEFS